MMLCIFGTLVLVKLGNLHSRTASKLRPQCHSQQGTQNSRLGEGSSGSISNFLTALGQRMIDSWVICFPSCLTSSDESFSRWNSKTEVTSLGLIIYHAQKDKNKVDLIFFLMKRRSELPTEFLKHCLSFMERDKAK